jgi:hypothetical protein
VAIFHGVASVSSSSRRRRDGVRHNHGGRPVGPQYPASSSFLIYLFIYLFIYLLQISLL